MTEFISKPCHQEGQARIQDFEWGGAPHTKLENDGALTFHLYFSTIFFLVKTRLALKTTIQAQHEEGN